MGDGCWVEVVGGDCAGIGGGLSRCVLGDEELWMGEEVELVFEEKE